MTQKIEFSFLKIITGSEISSRRLPIMKAKSNTSGPIIWLTACSHGDEVGTIVIIQELFKRLKKSPLLKGTIYAFPLMNPIGFETSSRDITLSEEDLNRSFPGDEDGSFAERIAFKIFSTIQETKPRLVIDLHNDWTNSIPYCLVDVQPGKQNKLAYKKARYFARKTPPKDEPIKIYLFLIRDKYLSKNIFQSLYFAKSCKGIRGEIISNLLPKVFSK